MRSHEDVVKRAVGTLFVSWFPECLLIPDEKMSINESRDFMEMVVKNMSVDKMEDIVTNDELSYIKDDNSDV